MKVVLDINILLQSLGKSSRFRPIWTAFLKEKFELLISTGVLLEYEEQIGYKTSMNVAKNVKRLILEAVNTEYVKIFYEWNAIRRDQDDNKYFDLAVSGNADFLVTNDHHFNDAKNLKFPKIDIISGETFLEIISNLQIK